MKPRLLAPIVIGLVVAVLHLLDGFDGIEHRLTDLRFQLTPRQASGEVVVIDIDPRSLDELHVWPWPRGYHATLLENLLAAGARRVAFDIDFSSRSVASEDDAEFARAVRAARGRVVLPIYRQWQSSNAGELTLMAVEPIPEFASHSVLASINVQPDTDGAVRRYHSRELLGDRSVPSLAGLLAATGRRDQADFEIDFGISTASLPRLSYIDVLTGHFDPALVANRSIIVGSAAIELGDQITVPLAAVMPGPHVQALAAESLIQDRALRRAPNWATAAWVMLLAGSLGSALPRLNWRWAMLAGLVSAATLFLAATLIQRSLPFIVDLAPMLIVTGGVFSWSLVAVIDQQSLSMKRNQLDLRRTESLMRHVVENSFDAIVTLGDDGRIETFNRAAERLFESPADEVAGQPVGSIVELDGPEARLARAAGAPVEAVGRRRGASFPIEMVVTAIEAADEPRLVLFMRDITERKAHEQELEHLAHHDSLTGLPNRLLLLDRMSALTEGRSAAVLLLDLDRFKEINDALGHPTGDRLLKQVASRLQLPLEPDDTIARLGGDEFAILLPGAGEERARRIASLLIDTLRSPFRMDGLTLQVDTSIGIAIWPEHGPDFDSLLQRADVAMYVAKRKRQGMSIYTPEQDYNSVRQLVLLGDLRNAIQDDRLHLVYQPQIRAEDGEILGVEALLRWRHPEHGMIPPDEFIHLAEHSGLIRPLTLWVVETALRQAAAWRSEGLSICISVNLSARNLLEEDLPRNLERLLERHEMPPELLTLEITESVLMDEPERALAVVTQLDQLGTRISIDDFGTGYSSLGYLMRLPAEEIKIDRSFVMQMERDSGSATIVRSIIELAHNLNLKVVAEGVETVDAWSTLKNLGCDTGQGYYFNRPISAEELTRWMADGARPAGEAKAAGQRSAPAAVLTV